MTSQTCFQSEDLVLLLGRSGRAKKEVDAARKHVASCEVCQQEFALLLAGFDTVAPAPISDEDAVLRRIEAALLSEVAPLERGDRRVPVPRPIATLPLRRLLSAGVLSSVAVSLMSLLLWVLMSPPGDLQVASLVALLLPPLLLPGMLLPSGPRWLLLATALMSTVALTFLGSGGGDGNLARESVCLLFAGAGLVPAAAVVRAGLRSRLSDDSGGGLIGAAVSAGGLGMQASLCHMDGPLHLFALHVVPFFLGILAFAALSRRWLRPDAAGPRQAATGTSR